MISYEDFLKVDVRLGKVLEVFDFPEAKKPAYKLKIDFGPEIGVKVSSGQFTCAHKKEDLLGKLVACVVNFPPKQIGPFVSEVLTLGFAAKKGGYIAFTFDEKDTEIGSRMC